jgi:hypothetical protein
LTTTSCPKVFSFTLLWFSPLSFFVISHSISKHPKTMSLLHSNPLKVENCLRWN